MSSLVHKCRVALAVLREWFKGYDPKWRTTERTWLAFHPLCEACSSPVHVQVHHKKPFHLTGQAGLETSFDNLMSLCFGPNECHLRIGHGGSWRTWNPDAAIDAAQCLRSPKSRPVVEAKAKTGRKLLFYDTP